MITSSMEILFPLPLLASFLSQAKIRNDGEDLIPFRAWSVNRENISSQRLVIPSYTVPQRGSGGIGRRASLRSWWPKGRRGSSPFFRTIYYFKTWTVSTCCFMSLTHGWGAFRIQFAVSHTA
jgi:hypothetical protein